MNKKKTVKKIGIVGLVLIFFVGTTFLLCNCSDFYKNIGFYESSDISTYMNYGVPDGDGLSTGYYNTFPEDLENVKVVDDYYFVANYPPYGNISWEIFLSAIYSEENFYLELDRIINIKGNYVNTGTGIAREMKFDSESFLFNFPTYVAEYDGTKDFGHIYEYISIDEANFRIIYVLLDRQSRKNQPEHYREIVLSEVYQPKNYYKNQNSSTLDGYYYNIYTRPDSDMAWFD